VQNAHSRVSRVGASTMTPGKVAVMTPGHLFASPLSFAIGSESQAGSDLA